MLMLAADASAAPSTQLVDWGAVGIVTVSMTFLKDPSYHTPILAEYVLVEHFEHGINHA